MSSITLNPYPLGGYEVVFCNGKAMGDIVANDDGYHVFFPNKGPGYWDFETLKEIADILESLDEPWHAQVIGDPTINKVPVTEDALNDVFDDLKSKLVPLLISKNRSYGDAWQGYGIVGQLFRLYEKLMRYKVLSASSVEITTEENIADTIRDLFGTLALMYLYTTRRDNIVERNKSL